MVIVWLMLACATPATEATTEASTSRATSEAGPPPAVGGVAPLIHPWSREEPAGECLVYSEDEVLGQRIVTTAEGRPLLVDRGNIRQRWYRSRRPDGTVAEMWVYEHSLTEARGVRLIAQERYDADERVIWRHRPPYSEGTLSYDAAGRLLKTESADASTTYTYTDAGQLSGHAWRGDEGSSGEIDYRWDADGRLVSVTSFDVWSDNSGVTWTAHSPAGLPTKGTRWRSDSSGNSDALPIQQAYDGAGHLISTEIDGRSRETWDWDGDRVVGHTFESLVSGGTQSESWEWDEEGRLVFQDDGKHVMTWVWDEGDDLAESTFDGQVSYFEGDCSLRILPGGLVEDPTPSPLPRMPAVPAAFGESEW